MNLRLFMIALFLFGIGIFANAQDKKQAPKASKSVIENGPDAIPVTVTSSPKKQKPKAPKAPEPVKFTAPVIVKDGDKKAPPPPPPPPMAGKQRKHGQIPPPPPPPLKTKGPKAPANPPADSDC